MMDINSMKRKVIENLIQVSGRPDIEKTYDVIVVNAKTALKGILEAKPKLLENSRISGHSPESYHAVRAVFY